MRDLQELRFDGARAAGLQEDHVERIDDADASATLPHRWRLAIRLTDALVADARIDERLRAQLLEEFITAEIVELTATLTTAIAFSKAAIAFGAPPEMPLTVVPTPAP